MHPNASPLLVRRAAARLRCVAVLGLSLILAGCFGRHRQEVGADMLDDKVTAERVQATLKDGGEFRSVRVRVAGGVVILTGHTATPAARERAARLAKTVDQVSGVENRIEIKPAPVAP